MVKWKYEGYDSQQSNMFKHIVESGHDPALKNNFKSLEKGYKNNTCRKVIAEALLITGLQELEILVHVFFCAPNNFFAYTIVHLTFRAS